MMNSQKLLLLTRQLPELLSREPSEQADRLLFVSHPSSALMLLPEYMPVLITVRSI